MYTIRQASLRTGVSVPLIRAWERRYGVPHPTRTASRYRLYDDHALALLAEMRRLVDDGWAPSQAAEHLRAVGLPEVVPVAEAASGDGAQPPAGDGTSPPQTRYGEVIERIVGGATTLDSALLERALDDAFAAGSFEAVAEGILMPALRGVGEAWARGEVDVAGEHLASGAVLRRLAAAFDAASSDEAGDIVVGLPPGSRHELGALAFAVAARRAGLSILYLGGDVPVSSWLVALAPSRVRAAVIGAISPDDVTSAATVARAVMERRPQMIVALGGPHADDVAPAAGPASIVLPGGLRDAVEALRRHLQGLAVA
jgi:DNA-binding transcriptional MerR regulator